MSAAVDWSVGSAMIRTGWMRAASSSPVPARSVKGTVQGQAGCGQPHPALRLQGQFLLARVEGSVVDPDPVGSGTFS